MVKSYFTIYVQKKGGYIRDIPEAGGQHDERQDKVLEVEGLQGGLLLYSNHVPRYSKTRLGMDKIFCILCLVSLRIKIWY